MPSLWKGEGNSMNRTINDLLVGMCGLGLFIFLAVIFMKIAWGMIS